MVHDYTSCFYFFSVSSLKLKGKLAYNRLIYSANTTDMIGETENVSIGRSDNGLPYRKQLN